MRSSSPRWRWPGCSAQPGEYAELPYFFTDQYDLGMEYVGHAPSFERVVFRGDVAGREFVAFWLDGDDRVLAGMNVNVWDVLDDVKALIRSRTPVDVDKLSDPQSSLADLPSVSRRFARRPSRQRRAGQEPTYRR